MWVFFNKCKNFIFKDKSGLLSVPKKNQKMQLKNCEQFLCKNYKQFLFKSYKP